MERKNDREYNIVQLLKLFHRYAAYSNARHRQHINGASPETLELIRAHAICNDDFKILLGRALYSRYLEFLAGGQDFESKRAAGELAACCRFDLKNELRALEIREANISAVLQAVCFAAARWFCIQTGRPVS